MDRSEWDVTLDDLMKKRSRQRAVEATVFAVVMTLAIVGFALLIGIATVSGQDRDVPSSARREIAMRGEQIERIDGQVRAAIDEDLIGQAAETPPDDSGKWHLTILTAGNCQACEKLKADLASADAFHDWVDVDDHEASHMHYHELDLGGAMGREWVYKLEKALGIKVQEFPTIVVQPPVNGKFGKHTQIAWLGQGYDGDAAKLTATMAAGLRKYLAKFSEVRALARAGGHRQSDEQDLGATPPPFLLAPTNPPPTSGLLTPQTLIPPRVAAGVEQIRQACQGCDAEFLLAMISKQATLEEVAQAWQGEVLQRQIEELKKLKDQATPAATPNPAAPAGFSLTTLIMSIVATLLGTGGLGGIIVFGLQLIRSARQASGKPTLLNDEQFAAFLVEIRKLLTPASQPAQS